MADTLKLGLFDDPDFGSVLDAPSRPRKNRTAPIWRLGDGNAAKASSRPSGSPHARRLAMLEAVAKRDPEVMVKITGTNTESGALAAHLDYLRRKDGAEIEDERGDPLDATQAAMKRVLKTWGVAVEEGHDNERKRLEYFGPKKHDSRKTIAIHIVLSMPAGTDAGRLMDAARGFAAEELENHQHVLVLHTDRDHPHVHIVVNNIGNDMQRLRRQREDLQRWREVFAHELRARGVDAAATPRKARGVIKKGEKFPVRKGKERLASARQEARRSDGTAAQLNQPLRVLRDQAERAINELRGVLAHDPDPAEVAARDNRWRLEQGLADAIGKLPPQGERGRLLAERLAIVRSGLPPAQTALDAMKSIAKPQRSNDIEATPNHSPKER